MSKKQTQVYIGGIDASSYIVKWEQTEDAHDGITENKVILSSTVTTIVTPEVGNQIEVWEGYSTPTDTKIFDGYVIKKETEVDKITLWCKNKDWQLVARQANKVYLSSDATAGRIYKIVEDLLDTYTTLNYTDGTTIIATNSNTDLAKFVCNRVSLFDRISELADAVDYQFYYKASDDKFYFEPRGYSENSNIIYVGGTNNVCAKPIKWKEDIMSMANRIIVIGAEQLGRETEFFDGDGSALQSFTLSYTPDDVQVWEDTTEKVFGRLNATSGTYDYYVDKENKKIHCTSNWTPASGTNNVKIEYSRKIPIPVIVDNEQSQTNYIKVERTLTKLDIKDVTDAETRGRKFLEMVSEPQIESKILIKQDKISSLGLEIGQRVTVEDTINNKTHTVYINKLRKFFPEADMEIQVGTLHRRDGEEHIKNIMTRVKRLEEKELENEDMLLNVKQIGANLAIQRRYLKLTTRDINSSMVYGHPTTANSAYGTADYGDNRGTEVIQRIIHPDNKYTEEFIDDDFKDTSNTTATWGSGEITFSSGQVAQSLTFAKNAETYTKATMTVTKSSGTFTYEMSADGGSHWENVTSGTEHTFTNSGTEIKWRITESGASTGTVTKVVIEFST